MASNNQVTVEELIKCGICKEIFKDPLLMPCSHTYCRKCIEKMVSEKGDEIECPLRDGYKILKKDVNTLPHDNSMSDLIELYKSFQNSNQCTICNLVTAKYICNTCQDVNFCEKCYQQEHITSLTQKHQRLSISQRSPEVILCEIHVKKQLEYWCHTCPKVICIDCLLFDHKEHKYALIDNATKEFDIKINNQLQGVQSSLKHRINEADILINEINLESDINRKKINEVMTSLRKIIDEHEKAIVEQISAIEKEQKKQLEDYKIPLKNDLQNLNLQIANSQILLSSKKYTQLLQNTQRLEEYVKKTNIAIKSKAMPTRTEYQLKGLDQFPTLKEKILQCGVYVEWLPLQLEQKLTANQAALTLDLNEMKLTDLDMKIVADVLRKTTSLTTLNLYNNQIGPQGAERIADALKVNQTLTKLNLQANQIGEQGAARIAETLTINQTLSTLDLRGNQIGEEGAKYIADAIKINQTLTTLDLRGNEIEQRVIQHMTETLETNKKLKVYW